LIIDYLVEQGKKYKKSLTFLSDYGKEYYSLVQILLGVEKTQEGQGCFWNCSELTH